MELNLALFIYLLVVLLTYMIGRIYRIRRFSSFVLALITGIVILGIIYPYPKAGRDIYKNKTIYKFSSDIIFYALIQILTWIIIFWYICNRILLDKETISCICYKNELSLKENVC